MMTDDQIDLSFIKSDRDYFQLIHFEFEQCSTANQAHATYKDYRDLDETNTNFNRLLALREEYSYALDRVTGRPRITTSIALKTKEELAEQPEEDEAPFKFVGGNARGGLPITEEEQEAIDKVVEPAEAPQPKSNREWYEHYKALFPTAKYNPRMKGIDNLTQLEFFQLLTFQLSREFDKAELPSFNDVVLHTCSIQSVAAAQEYIKELASRINK